MPTELEAPNSPRMSSSRNKRELDVLGTTSERKDRSDADNAIEPSLVLSVNAGVTGLLFLEKRPKSRAMADGAASTGVSIVGLESS